ncbi:MAG: T9SS type A sorting domain-containing protein, partial [Bacteroidota bacterium]
VELPSFQGGELEVDSECAGDSVIFRVENIGTGTTGPVEYAVQQDNVLYEDGTVEIQAGEVREFIYPATGATWRMVFSRPTDAPYLTHGLAIEEGCTGESGGEVSVGFATALSLLDFDPYFDRYCIETTASFDPNDKQANPRGIGPENYIYPNGTFDYRVRFQNTGTDTAFTVIIRDTLDASVYDLTSFRAGISSHPYELTRENDSILVFTFGDILLPDCTTNEPASNGFVHFSVAQQPDLPDFTRIENTASIYFDFNEPILTNISGHTVNRTFLVSPVFDPALITESIFVFPNPASESVTFSSTDWPGELTVTLYDFLGREILNALLPTNGSSVSLANLRVGMYVYALRKDGILIQTGKLMKKTSK